jgi:hypothetical protein
MTLAKVRKALRDSHVAAIASAILLLQLIDSFFVAVEPAPSHIFYLLVRNVEMRYDPFFHPPVESPPLYLLLWLNIVCSVTSILLSFFVTWMLCKWTYGTSPLKTLAELRRSLSAKYGRRSDA